MPWKLLRVPADWESYRVEAARLYGLAGLIVPWGPGPSAYPCLVDSRPNKDGSVACAYVYREHAEELLDAAACLATRVPRASRPDTPRGDHARSVSAHVLTIVQLLVDTGIVKPEQYEPRYQAFLRQVDQWTEDDHQRLLAGDFARG